MDCDKVNPLNRSPIQAINRWPITSIFLFESLKHVTAWLSYFAGTEFASIIVFCSLIPSARADNGDDLANNLFSDLAPILALFGEQVAKQFLSESMGWADNILFAMAPLGVITGIISAIRVGGPSWLKAIVGRAREGRADVEMELMSSNSPDVGEMWNGQTIVRVLGSPSIFQLVYAPEKIEAAVDPANCIDVLDGTNGFFRPAQNQSGRLDDSMGTPNPDDYDYDQDIELRPLLFDSTAYSRQANNKICPPNISLNARGESVSGWEKWLWALFGISTQLAVLVYGGLISYHPSWVRFINRGQIPPSQAFQLAAVGTVSLTFGMLICSYVIESASTETDWVRKDVEDSGLKVAWVQKGGTVGDQAFEPYLIFGHEGQRVVRTSQRCDTKTGIKLQYWVLLGTFVSVAGFIIQFTGLRRMHWSATIVQLTAMGLMTIVRSIVRRRMSREPTAAKAVEGHELDCMARIIGGCGAWKVIPEQCSPADNETAPEEGDNVAGRVVKIRKHLGKLSEWPADVQDTARILCTAMKKTMNTIYESNEIVLTDDALKESKLSWTLKVLTLDEAPPLATKANWFSRLIQQRREQPSESESTKNRTCCEDLTFELTRYQRSGIWEPWEITEDTIYEITVVLSLWMLRFREEESYYQNFKPSLQGGGGLRRNAEKSARVLRVWPSHEVDREHFKLWMGTRGIVDIRVGDPALILEEEKIPAHRLIGNLKADGDRPENLVVAIIPNTPIQKLFAQQIFSNFFSAVVLRIKTIPGSTNSFEHKISALKSLGENKSPGTPEGLQRSFNGDSLEFLEIRNGPLNHLVETVCETGLGTKQEVLMGKFTPRS